MFYVEGNFRPDEKEQDLFDFVLGNDCPFYYQKTTDNYRGFTHTLMNRNPQNTPEMGVVNSSLYEHFEAIFKKICTQNNLNVSTILRAAINTTSYSSEKHGEIHVDENFEHKNFIFYLNDFTDAPTYIFDRQNNIVKTTDVGKNKFVIFSGEPHAQGFCKPNERRVVLVFTFV